MASSQAGPLAILRETPLFRDMAPARFVRLLGAMEPLAYRAGEVVARAGEPAAGLLLAAQQDFQLVTPGGREVAAPTSSCGEEIAAGIDRYALSAVARRDGAGWSVPADALRAFARDNPECVGRAFSEFTSRLAMEPVARPSMPPPRRQLQVGLFEVIGWTMAVALPPLAYLLGAYIGWTPQAAMTIAIGTAMIVLWVFALVDEFIPPLLAIVAILFVGLAPPAVALAGFSSAGFVMLVGVFALAAIITASGLSYRAMLWLLLKMPDRPLFHRSVLLFGGFALSPVMPSGNNRLSLLLPLYRDMLEGLKVPPGSRAATGLMAATFSGAMLMSPMLATSKSANIVAVSLLPAQIQAEFLGLFWGLAAGVAALGVTVLHGVLSAGLFRGPAPRSLPKERIVEQLALLGPLAPAERLASLGFLFFLAAAGSYAWHQVPMAWFAGVVLVVLLISGQFSKQDFRREIDWPMLFFLVGLDSITRIMDHHGLQVALAGALAPWFQFVDGRLEVFVLAALAVTLLVRLVLPLTAGMLASFVILLPIAEANGIHPWICLFLATMFSDIWFLPYQSSVFLQFTSQVAPDSFDRRRFFLYNNGMNVARVVVAYASIPWWRWLGLA